LVYFIVTWDIFLVLVCCTKKIWQPWIELFQNLFFLKYCKNVSSLKKYLWREDELGLQFYLNNTMEIKSWLYRYL
jgi:hypothetical protein